MQRTDAARGQYFDNNKSKRKSARKNSQHGLSSVQLLRTRRYGMDSDKKCLIFKSSEDATNPANTSGPDAIFGNKTVSYSVFLQLQVVREEMNETLRLTIIATGVKLTK